MGVDKACSALLISLHSRQYFGKAVLWAKVVSKITLKYRPANSARSNAYLVTLEQNWFQNRIHNVSSSKYAKKDQNAHLGLVIKREKPSKKIGYKAHQIKQGEDEPEREPLLVIFGLRRLDRAEAPNTLIVMPNSSVIIES
jgi:hypothetical protein